MKKAIIGSLYFVPMLAFAQDFVNLITLTESFQDLLDVVAPVIFGIAIIYFFWGVAKYILAAGDPKAAAEGKSIMIWGVVALAVMASIYGLINFLANAFNLDGATIAVPTLPR